MDGFWQGFWENDHSTWKTNFIQKNDRIGKGYGILKFQKCTPWHYNM